MIRYRNMLAYQYSSIQADGEGDVATCLAQMLAIYQTVNADFAVHGFTDFMSMDYLASFERRFGSLDTKARRHLWAMLGRAEGLTDNPMEEARCLLSRVGIAVTDDGLNAARRIMCEARSAAAGDTKRG